MTYVVHDAGAGFFLFHRLDFVHWFYYSFLIMMAACATSAGREKGDLIASVFSVASTWQVTFRLELWLCAAMVSWYCLHRVVMIFALLVLLATSEVRVSFV